MPAFYLCRFLSVDFFLSIAFFRLLSGSRLCLGAHCRMQLFHLSLLHLNSAASSISAAMLGADFYERVTRPGCALRPEPFLAYLEPGLDR